MMRSLLPALLLSGCAVCAQNGVADANLPIDSPGMHVLTVDFVDGATIPEGFILSVEMNAFAPGDAHPITLTVSRDGEEIGRETSNLPQVFDPNVTDCGDPCTYDVEVMLDFLVEMRQLSLYASHGNGRGTYDCVEPFVTMTLE